MGSLQFITALQLSPASKSIEDIKFLTIDLARSIQSSGRSLVVDGFPPIDRLYIIHNYIEWLINSDRLPFYDVFISNRRNKDDDKVSSESYNALGDDSVCPEKRPLRVFTDDGLLAANMKFQKDCDEAVTFCEMKKCRSRNPLAMEEVPINKEIIGTSQCGHYMTSNITNYFICFEELRGGMHPGKEEPATNSTECSMNNNTV